MRRSVLVLLTALALPAQVALAGLFDDKEARASIEKMRSDIDRMSDRVELASKNQIDFVNQSEAMKADVAQLRGQLEVLMNQMDTAEKRQRDFYVDIDNRLRKLETTAAAADTKAPAQKDSAQETRDYETALNAFKANRYVDSNNGMLAFIRNYPNSTLLPNAYYWAGSSHFQLHEFAKAVDMFAKVSDAWPNSDKAPDALLAQSNALNEMGNAKDARKVLQKLQEQYPTSAAAQAAKQKAKKK